MTLERTILRMDQEGDTDIVVRRNFSHPPARVWQALTEPALIRRWMGQDAMTCCQMDLRPGGSFHYEWEEFYFSGPILSVDAPPRMVHIEHFNGDMSSGPEITTELHANAAGTRMTMTMRYASAEARTAAIAAGFTHGFDQVFERLAAVLTNK